MVKRLLEQYNALDLYFTNAFLGDQIQAAEKCLTSLKNPSFKLYLEFLDFALPLFNQLTLEMQSESVKIHVLYQRVETILKTLMGCFLTSDYIRVTDLQNLDFKNPRNFLKIEDIYLGAVVIGKIENNLHNLSKSELLIFRQRCLDFFIEACGQIYKRFNFKESTQKTIKLLGMLDPKTVFNKTFKSIAPLAILFTNLVKQNSLNDLDREWREIQSLDLSNYESCAVLEFWQKIYQIKAGNDEFLYKNVCEFIFNLLCLPHSSATVERIFSQINLNKTKTRNRLCTKTLTGILHSKNLVKNSTCFSFKIDKELVAKLNNSIYDNTT